MKILGIDFGIKSRFLRFATRSPKWSSVRKQHLKDNPCCAACGRCDKLEVHHIEPVHVNPNRELDPSNLITLCDSPCHMVFGHLMNYKSWNSNVASDCQEYLLKIKDRP
jgi:5-methylcytosine-specific restriction endonuclease McrA